MHSELNLCDILTNKLSERDGILHTLIHFPQTQKHEASLTLSLSWIQAQSPKLTSWLCVKEHNLRATLGSAPPFACVFGTPGDTEPAAAPEASEPSQPANPHQGLKGPSQPPQAGGGLDVCAAVKLGAGLEVVPQLQKLLLGLLTMEPAVRLLYIQSAEGFGHGGRIQL